MMKILTDRVIELLEPILHRAGFSYRKSQRRFVRRDREVVRSLSIYFTPRGGDVYRLEFSAGLRFTRIEELLNRYRPRVSDASKRRGVTVGTHIYNLLPSTDALFDWRFADTEDVEAQKVSILEAIEKFALPYLHKINSIEDLSAMFELDDSNVLSETKAAIELAICVLKDEPQRGRMLVEKLKKESRDRWDPAREEQFVQILKGISRDFTPFAGLAAIWEDA